MRAVLTAVVLGVVAASTDGDTWGTCRFTQSCFPQSLDDWYCFPTAVNASNSFPLAVRPEARALLSPAAAAAAAAATPRRPP
jgi:hypothetical protein